MGGAALVVAVAYWWSCGSSGGDAASRAATAAPATPGKVRVYRDGQWVTRDTDQLWQALDTIRHRPAGLLRVEGRVIDYRSGAGVPGAEVVFAGPGGEATSVSEDDGNRAGEKFAKSFTLGELNGRPGDFFCAVATGPGITEPWWPMMPPYQPDSPDFDPFVMGVSPAVWIP